eukprot:TRINITY_DN70276_c0_g1_i1.p1 TRINITY_DN70276_c0_g1~~TRINITY_DN70276_c0_g1_i1.p1  ORF type:complete len:384 (+),score=49.49 TRINITY_DN70276_c0_g1_i1:73-1224(+)
MSSQKACDVVPAADMSENTNDAVQEVVRWLCEGQRSCFNIDRISVDGGRGCGHGAQSTEKRDAMEPESGQRKRKRIRSKTPNWSHNDFRLTGCGSEDNTDVTRPSISQHIEGRHADTALWPQKAAPTDDFRQALREEMPVEKHGAQIVPTHESQAAFNHHRSFPVPTLVLPPSPTHELPYPTQELPPASANEEPVPAQEVSPSPTKTVSTSRPARLSARTACSDDDSDDRPIVKTKRRCPSVQPLPASHQVPASCVVRGRKRKLAETCNRLKTNQRVGPANPALRGKAMRGDFPCHRPSFTHLVLRGMKLRGDFARTSSALVTDQNTGWASRKNRMTKEAVHDQKSTFVPRGAAPYASASQNPGETTALMALAAALARLGHRS